MINELKNEMMKLKNSISKYFASEDKVWSESEVKISQPEVGGKVELIDGDGNLSPAPDGDYVMDNGFAFKVKDGQIQSIVGEDKPAEEEEKKDEESVVTADVRVVNTEEAPAEEAPSEDNKEVAELKEKVSSLEQAVSDLKAELEALKGSAEVAASKVDVENFTIEVANLHETIKQLAKVPVEFSKTNNNNIVKDSKEDKLIELAKMLGSKK